jgi:nifR3 family TIM-barrel protein
VTDTAATTSPSAPSDPFVAPTAMPALRIGPLEVSPPVVLAPMAGITNTAFRRVCRSHGDGLFVSEMVTARGLVEGSDKSWARAGFAPDESTRSIQLYGSDPSSMGEAVRRLVTEGRVDHIDINLGCPVRKITRHGGGSALTARPRLLAALLGAAVDNAGPVPVTVKFRIGIDESLPTFLDAGRIAEEAGCAAVALHGRTAAQLYSGVADWSAIATLKENVRTIPVLGNGDIWSADAVRMHRETGCDGVVVGRGCLGRPWLFRDLADAFAGRPVAGPPPLGEVLDTMAWHAELLADHLGEERALIDFRKHVPWYLTGYPVGSSVRKRVHDTTTLVAFRAVLDSLDRSIVPLPGAVDQPRGTHRGPQTVTLPDRWLAGRDSLVPPGALAEAHASGG